jgi:hypothetical protein
VQISSTRVITESLPALTPLLHCSKSKQWEMQLKRLKNKAYLEQREFVEADLESKLIRIGTSPAGRSLIL